MEKYNKRSKHSRKGVTSSSSGTESLDRYSTAGSSATGSSTIETTRTAVSPYTTDSDYPRIQQSGDEYDLSRDFAQLGLNPEDVMCGRSGGPDRSKMSHIDSRRSELMSPSDARRRFATAAHWSADGQVSQSDP